MRWGATGLSDRHRAMRNALNRAAVEFVDENGAAQVSGYENGNRNEVNPRANERAAARLVETSCSERGNHRC